MIEIDELKFMFTHHYKGYFNRIPLSVLCDHFKQKNGREIRRAIHDLRTEGFLIVANSKNKGYWLTTKEMIQNDPIEFDEVELMTKAGFHFPPIHYFLLRNKTQKSGSHLFYMQSHFLHNNIF